MSARYLGTPFDIHGGGEDLIFPHHENEIAQAEALTGKTFVRYWLHNGFITVRQEKMSKSLGNVTGLRELVGRYTGSALRMFFLGAQYRNPIEYSEERLQEAASKLDTIYNCLEMLDVFSGPPPMDEDIPYHRDELQQQVKTAKDEFRRHMDDDLNTAGALGAVFRVVDAINARMVFRRLGRVPPAATPWLRQAGNTLRELLGVLGLPPERERPASGELEDRLIELLVDVRKDARQAKQFAIGDHIRAEMKAMGIEIEDQPGGGARVVRRVVREDE
jgi:cysteinyl-tRNA synthetase